jgi:hypothetical protein
LERGAELLVTAGVPDAAGSDLLCCAGPISGVLLE